MSPSVWFTSDHHFGHNNIIKFCKRPFDSTHEMNKVLTDNWNSKIKKGDSVYHLGDLTLGDDGMKYLSKLNGTIILVCPTWHHDRSWIKNFKKQTSPLSATDEPIVLVDALLMVKISTIKIAGRSLKITLCHYPMAEWEASHYGMWHLHGHSHGNHQGLPGRFILDIGVDNHDYYPVSIEEIEKQWQTM